MTVQDLIAAFQGYLTAGDGYIAGTSGVLWTQEAQNKATNEMTRRYGQRWVGRHVEDCSGAFVRAYKAHGLSIYHGSNRIAREYVAELLPVSDARPGMAAFKLRRPGEQGYDLPGEYRAGGKRYNGDLNDYYHIGLVDTDTRYVLNSQSTQNGFRRSKMTDGWAAVGWLKAAKQEGGDKPMQDALYTATVESVNGKPVNLRKSPSKNAEIIATVPVGTAVDVLNEADSEWAEIRAGKHTGYMMRMYLAATAQEPGEAVIHIRALLSEARAKLDEADKLLGGM